MLNVLNTKLLLAILALVTALGSLVTYDHVQSEKTAAIIKQQQQEAQRQRQAEEDYRRKVAEEQKKHNTNPANGSKAWTTFIP